MSYVIKISPSPPLQAEKNIRDVIKIDTKFSKHDTKYKLQISFDKNMIIIIVNNKDVFLPK